MSTENQTATPTTDVSEQDVPVLGRPLEVRVVERGVERAIRKLRRLMASEGVLREIKRRRHYEKPSIKGKIIAKKLISRADQLKDLNRFERFIVEKFAKPVYYRFNADYKIIFQVNGADETVEGTGVYVYQQLNK